MKSIFFRSIVIALLLGVIVTFLTNVVLYSYTAQNSVTGFTEVIVGLEAVKSHIQAFGVRAYGLSVFLTFCVSSAVLFFAAFAQGVWFMRSPLQ